ncbi:MAG: DUF2889 domain-containing protein [Pseudomonadales bacterium]|nr:DUF2889 domain-containing protein [Pseudomonadales bacterium]
MPDYPLNPAYGTGVYRRRIRLKQGEGYVHGALEDTNHGFEVRVFHEAGVVTAIEPQAHRVPYTSCPGALERIKAFVGVDIHSSLKELNRYQPPSSNCTHLLDLTVMTIRQAATDEAVRQWDIAITDQTDEADSIATVTCNGEEVFRWQARDLQLTAPDDLAGKPFYLGFGKWASKHFPEEKLEAAFILQKGYFVSIARRFDMNKLAGEPALAQKDGMYGACYTYTSPAIEHGVRTENTMLDFTDCEEQLLQFR